LGACGNGKAGADGASSPAGDPSPTTSAQSNSLASLVPADIAKTGAIVFAVQGHPPYTIMNGSTPTGPNADLQNAIGAELGLKVQTVDVEGSIDPILAGILSGRYNAFAGPSSITPERTAQFDLVNWAVQFAQYLVPSNASEDPMALCGATVATLVDAPFNVYVQNQSKYCVSQGKKPIATITQTTSDNEALAVKSGRVAAAVVPNGTATYIVGQDSALKTVDFPTQARSVATNMGLIIQQGGLAKAIVAALKALISNGTYAQIMKKYGLDNEMIKTAPEINGSSTAQS
jgi:polar amino acid transport system substrate-binding protein